MIENGNKYKDYIEFLKKIKKKEKKEDILIQEIKNQQKYIPKNLNDQEEKNVENKNVIHLSGRRRRRRVESFKKTKEKNNMAQYSTKEETENIPNLLEQSNNIGKVNEINNNSKKNQQYINTNNNTINKNNKENNNQTNFQNIDSDEYSYASLINNNNNNNYTPVCGDNNTDDNTDINEYISKHLNNYKILFDCSKLLDKSVEEKLKNNLLLGNKRKKKISKCK